jgi:NAD+ synthase (glutamine-hydrolysing)
MAQTNPVVGDISANLNECFAVVQAAAAQGANLVLFGEMSATGYPIEDLATRRAFVELAETSIDEFATRLEAAGLGQIHVVIGHPALAPQADRDHWAIAQNCASVLHNGKVIGRYAKHHLPNYSVFDEYRVFVPGNQLLTFNVNGLNCSVLICEDIWQDGGPVAQLAGSGTQLLLVLNGSPFELGKQHTREQLVRNLATTHNTAVAYVNLVGGQDDLVFDGNSLLLDAAGNVKQRLAGFTSEIRISDIDGGSQVSVADAGPATQEPLAEVWNALVLGLRDYVNKNGFKSVVLGLSGGIDSAVCAAIAADAIGADRVFGVSLPSKYSSDHSKSDAFDLAERLGVQIRTEAIANVVDVAETQLKLDGLAAENLQARVRGVILMALSNAEGHLTLTTGNKTELAVGYSTIYGDSVGGYAPIKDVAKTMVWDLARWRNQQAIAAGLTPPIPENSISKPPSAELRPGQVDQDSLPEYDQLDRMLELYIDELRSRDEIIDAGFDSATVDKVISLVDRSEWKRRQGAIGPKITGMAFGRDRRMPITNRYRHKK